MALKFKWVVLIFFCTFFSVLTYRHFSAPANDEQHKLGNQITTPPKADNVQELHRDPFKLLAGDMNDVHKKNKDLISKEHQIIKNSGDPFKDFLDSENQKAGDAKVSPFGSTKN